MNLKKSQSSLMFSCLGLFFIFFLLLSWCDLEYKKEMKGQIRLIHYYLAKSLAYTSMLTYEKDDLTTQQKSFKEGTVRLVPHGNQQVRIVVDLANDSFAFIEDVPEIDEEKE